MTSKQVVQEDVQENLGAVVGSRTASVDLTSASTVIKFHTPPSAVVPAVGSTVTGTGVGASAVVVASPAPTTDQFSVSVASSATSSAVTATFGSAGAPEQVGALVVSSADVLAAGYFGKRSNTHADSDYALPNLVNGNSPGDWDNKYDAPGGIDWGAGSYTGTPGPGQNSGGN